MPSNKLGGCIIIPASKLSEDQIAQMRWLRLKQGYTGSPEPVGALDDPLVVCFDVNEENSELEYNHIMAVLKGAQTHLQSKMEQAKTYRPYTVESIGLRNELQRACSIIDSMRCAYPAFAAKES